MNKLNILFINHYSITPSKGGASRHYEIGKRLSKNGHDITLIGGCYHHHLKKNISFTSPFEISYEDGLKVIWLRLKKYSNPQGVWRFINWLTFAIRILLLNKENYKKPDVIYYSSLSLVGVIAAYLLSKIHRAKFIFEVRDIWPLSIQELKGISKHNPAVIFLRLIEKFGYKKADLIVSTIPGLTKHLVNSGIKDKQSFHSPNGIENTEYPNIFSPVFEKIKKKQSSKFVVGYAGSIGTPNGVETLVEAANALKEEKGIFFTIVGDGPCKKDLIDLSKKYKLNNIFFADRVPRQEVHQIIESFDVAFHGQSIITPLYDFGISPNKMADYMLHGKPVVNAYSGGEDPVKKFNCGITVPALDHKGVANSIMQFNNMEKEIFLKMSTNAKQAINFFYDYDVISSHLEYQLLGLFK